MNTFTELTSEFHKGQAKGRDEALAEVRAIFKLYGYSNEETLEKLKWLNENLERIAEDE